MNTSFVYYTVLLGYIKGVLRDGYKVTLYSEFELLCKLLPLSPGQLKQLRQAFMLSFDEHWKAPNRASGEIYFLHIFRQVMQMMRLMVHHKVTSSKNIFLVLMTILLHDCIEDAEKAQTTPFIVYSTIVMLFRDVVAGLVQSITKNKQKETRSSYLLRLAEHPMWQLQLCKLPDGNDNTKTLAATPLEGQAGKVREVFVYYPKIMTQLLRHLEFETREGLLSDGYQWIALAKHMHRLLRRNAYTQKRRLETLSIVVL